MARPFCPFLSRVLPPLLLAMIIGCGSPGAPAPPSLKLPAPVRDLTAVRIDTSVRLNWTMPTHSTDRLILKGPISARVCRAIESGPCRVAATLSFAPGKPAEYTDALPAELTHGPARLLSYQVDLLNHGEKSAGRSNSAFTAAGLSPPAVTGLTAQVRRDGVLLSWHPSIEIGADTTAEGKNSMLFRIKRVRQNPISAGRTAASGAKSSPETQILAVHSADGADPGHALDKDAALNQQYQYTVERVSTVELSGHAIEVQGHPSDSVAIATNDVFPPAVPQDLAAVADTTAGAIDLSWTPDSDAELAGYVVYRRDLESGLPAERISPPGTPLTIPNFRDTGVRRGHTYAYSVSAISKMGYQSDRSHETTETLPN
jgi:hypothetical protein